MKIKLLRNATCLINFENKTLLLDPMLGAKASFDPMPWTSNGIRNPTVDLPLNKDELVKTIEKVDFILLSHLHPDHWDGEATKLISKNKLIVCQAEDKEVLMSQGVKNLKIINGFVRINDLNITQTLAIHGPGELGKKMGPTSGFILEHNDHKIYLAGDSIWCEEVKNMIETHKPDCVVLNCGGAKFDGTEPIIMDLDQVKEVCSVYSGNIVCMHLEALNHCYTTRAELIDYFKDSKYSGNWFVPNDGEEIVLKYTSL